MENYRAQKNEKAVIASYKGPCGKVPWISSLGKHEERIKKKRGGKQKRRETGKGEEGRKIEVDRVRERECTKQTLSRSRLRAASVRSFARARGLRYCRKPPTSEPISTVADVTVIRRLFPDVTTKMREREREERAGDGNRLRPEIISSLFELDVWSVLFMKERGKEQRDTVIEFI